MISPTMLEEFFTVIRRKSEDTIVPPVRRSQRTNQPLDLLIHPTDSGIVESENFTAMALKFTRLKIGTIPKGIQVTRPPRSERSLRQHGQGCVFGIVRRVRIHQVQPQEKRLVSCR